MLQRRQNIQIGKCSCYQRLLFQTITRGDWMKYDYLQGLPFQNITSRLMILLGQDNINLTVARKVCQGPENTPIATKTHLGWILHGPTDFSETFSQFSFHICLREQANGKLHDLVEQTFSIESLGISNNHKNPDKSVDRAINSMEKSIKRIDDYLTLGEIKEAELKWIEKSQYDSFSEDISMLKDAETLGTRKAD
ncbi:hypothetical protein JTB14_034757 [Gonioctena quinquepunctata]|nr:hypothetical protein JTB14_034757 [Gonioctena quinquepunctata]